MMRPSEAGFRRVVWFAGLANLVFFVVEAGVALSIGSVGLFADSVDFLEDACVNALVLYALHATPLLRARVGMALSASILLPSLATLWMAWEKFNLPSPPAYLPLTLTGAGALAINLTCALLLANHRNVSGSLSKAAILSARNDVVANLAIMISGGVTAVTASGWPDLVVGLGIAIMNAGAAREVWRAARGENLAVKASG
jgi:Co/Zn/Cd efflux system component